MNDQIITTLKKRIEETPTSIGEIAAEVQRNSVKEVLQYYVLNFIYHHPEYSNWIMYGGSALRIIHKLDRMSVDLDFEVGHEIENDFLNKLREEILKHFKSTYGIESDFLTISIQGNRSLVLKFHIGEELGLDFASKQVHIKIDLDPFSAPEKVVIERWPQNEYQLSFVIKTYNLSSLMASKIAAIFLRGQRGVGKAMYEEKGRDIYDLLWYMKRKAVPDLDYLRAKNIEREAKDFRTLFDSLTRKILSNPGTDANLKGDLSPLFGDQRYIEDWIKNWRDSYLRLRDEYKINTVTTLEEPSVFQDFHTDALSFTYWYNTEDGKSVRIIYRISDYWIHFRDGDLLISVDEKIKTLIKFNSNGWSNRSANKEKLMQYVTLFYNKTENYLKKTNRIILGDLIKTKFIRMTADNLNPKEEILLNKSALESSELDDLLK